MDDRGWHIYRNFSIANCGAVRTLSSTLVGNSVMVGIVKFTHFSFGRVVLDIWQVEVASEKYQRTLFKKIQAFEIRRGVSLQFLNNWPCYLSFYRDINCIQNAYYESCLHVKIASIVVLRLQFIWSPFFHHFWKMACSYDHCFDLNVAEESQKPLQDNVWR